MALSEREQQLLAQLEQQLNADDPQFATVMESQPVRSSFSTRGLVLGVVIGVIGLGVVIGGVAINQVLVGVLGFLIMSLGVYWASTQGTRKSIPSAATDTISDTHNERKVMKSSSGFMRNLEDKWDERRSNGF